MTPRPTFLGDLTAAKRFAVLPENERATLAAEHPELAALIPGGSPPPPPTYPPTYPLVIVTPAMAGDWLRHSNQDMVHGAKLNRFIDAMRSGQWSAPDPGDPIHIANGGAQDGNHRLYAILYSGIAQHLYVKETP